MKARIAACAAALLLAASVTSAPAAEATRLQKLEVVSGPYPRAFFFRISEDLARAAVCRMRTGNKRFCPWRE